MRAEHGIITKDTLVGVPRGVVRHAVASGRWQQLFEGVYRVVGAPKPPGVVVHRSRDACTPSLRRGIAVTNPMRTLVDAGAVVPKLVVAQALDAAVAHRLVTAQAVEAELARLARRGRPGVGVLRSVLEDRDCIGRSPSVLEQRAARLFAISRVLPAPVPELIAGPNGEFRLDFPWPDALLDVELDGWEWHSSYAASLLDKRRNNALTRQGYALLRYGWLDLVRRPRAVLREVEATYTERLSVLCKQMVV